MPIMPARPFARCCRLAALAVACALAPAFASASGLQVSPTSLTLQAEQAADGLWLSNSGDAPLQAQVRVYAWTQVDGEDTLEPAQAIAISPPMVSIPVGGRQLVRVIRTGAPAIDRELAFRVVVDELPLPDGERDPGLQFVLRYSVPVFLAPEGEIAPDLEARLSRYDGRPALDVVNDGRMHAQLADLDYVDGNGQRHRLKPGLIGYVLPGQRMRWPLDAPAGLLESPGGHFEARINGEPEARALPSSAPAR